MTFIFRNLTLLPSIHSLNSLSSGIDSFSDRTSSISLIRSPCESMHLQMNYYELFSQTLFIFLFHRSLATLTGKEVIVKLKWGQEYKGD